MKVRISTLRRIIREALIVEDPGTPGFVDPVQGPKGFYDYEMERGTDLFGDAYNKPGVPQGTHGDFRPEDAFAYIGLHPPADDPTNTPAAADGKEGEEAFGDAAKTDVQDASELPAGTG